MQHTYLSNLGFTETEAAFLLQILEFQEYPLEPKPRKHLCDLIRGIHEVCHDMLVGAHEATTPLPPNLQRLYAKVGGLSTANAAGAVAYGMGWWAGRRYQEPVPAVEPPLEPLFTAEV